MDETQSTDLSFDKALTCLLAGVRMAARFMPDSIFIQLQKPYTDSAFTEQYLEMVKIKETEHGPVVETSEPWEPGRRSIFSDQWYTSKHQGRLIAASVSKAA